MNKAIEKKNIIIELSFQFSLSIIAYCQTLNENKQYVISQQLLKSGTSIGANIREAQSAESKNDFIHKFKIAEKEAEETEYWLELCKFSKNFPNLGNLLENLVEIKKIVAKIIVSAKSNN